MPVPVEYFMSFTPASGWGFALSEINARRSNNIIGHRQINEGTTIIPNAGENGEGDDLVINRIRIENIYDTSFAFSTTLIPFQDHPPDIHRFDGRGGIVIVRPARSKHQQKKFEECLAAHLAKYTRAVDSINAKSQINYDYQSRNYVLAAFGLGTGAIMRENPKSIRIRTTFSNVTTNRVQLWVGVVLATGTYILVRTQTLAIEAEDFKKETDNFIDEYDKCSALFPNDWVRPPTFNEYIQDNRTSPFRTTHPFNNLFHIAADEHFQFQFIR